MKHSPRTPLSNSPAPAGCVGFYRLGIPVHDDVTLRPSGDITSVSLGVFQNTQKPQGWTVLHPAAFGLRRRQTPSIIAPEIPVAAAESTR